MGGAVAEALEFSPAPLVEARGAAFAYGLPADGELNGDAAIAATAALAEDFLEKGLADGELPSVFDSLQL